MSDPVRTAVEQPDARGEVVPRAPEELDVTERERPKDLLVAHALVLRRQHLPSLLSTRHDVRVTESPADTPVV